MKNKKLLGMLCSAGILFNLTGCSAWDNFVDYWKNITKPPTTSQTEERIKVNEKEKDIFDMYQDNEPSVTKDYFVPYKNLISIDNNFRSLFNQYYTKNKEYKVFVYDNFGEDYTSYIKEAFKYLDSVYNSLNPNFHISVYTRADGYKFDNTYACAIEDSPLLSGNVLGCSSIFTNDNGEKLAKITLNTNELLDISESWDYDGIYIDCILKRLVVHEFTHVVGLMHSNNISSIEYPTMERGCNWQYSPQDLKTIVANYATINSDQDAQKFKKYINVMAQDFYSHILNSYIKAEGVTDEFKNSLTPITISSNQKMYLRDSSNISNFSYKDVAINDSSVGYSRISSGVALSSIYESKEKFSEDMNSYIFRNQDETTKDKIDSFIVLESLKNERISSSDGLYYNFNFIVHGDYGYFEYNKQTSPGHYPYSNDELKTIANKDGEVDSYKRTWTTVFNSYVNHSGHYVDYTKEKYYDKVMNVQKGNSNQITQNKIETNNKKQENRSIVIHKKDEDFCM